MDKILLILIDLVVAVVVVVEFGATLKVHSEVGVFDWTYTIRVVVVVVVVVEQVV